MKMQSYLLWNIDSVIENKLSKNNIGIMKINAKICTIHLRLCNIEVPAKLLEKRNAVLNDKQSMSKNSKHLQSIEPEH